MGAIGVEIGLVLFGLKYLPEVAVGKSKRQGCRPLKDFMV